MTDHKPITGEALSLMKAFWKEEDDRNGTVSDVTRCIAEIESLTHELQEVVAKNTKMRQEVAKLMVALDKQEINMSMQLMNEFYRILGQKPPYAE